MAGGDTAVLVGGAGPDGLALLRFRPSLWSGGLECYLAELYVVPALRGQGLGRALLDAAIALARERGADYMDLGTSEDDVAARALYESAGFTNREGRAGRARDVRVRARALTQVFASVRSKLVFGIPVHAAGSGGVSCSLPVKVVGVNDPLTFPVTSVAPTVPVSRPAAVSLPGPFIIAALHPGPSGTVAFRNQSQVVPRHVRTKLTPDRPSTVPL